MLDTPTPDDTGVSIGRDAEFWYETGGEGRKKRRDRYTGIVIGRQPNHHEIRSHDLGGWGAMRPGRLGESGGLSDDKLAQY